MFVSMQVKLAKVKVCLIWLCKMSWFPLEISMLSLLVVISSVLLVVQNEKLNMECIIPHLL